jgi:hypothetical protein
MKKFAYLFLHDIAKHGGMIEYDGVLRKLNLEADSKMTPYVLVSENGRYNKKYLRMGEIIGLVKEDGNVEKVQLAPYSKRKRFKLR